MNSPIVINIPGAQLLSSKGSGANRRGHWTKNAPDTKLHRSGANENTARAIAGSVGGFFVEMLHRKRKPVRYYAARKRGQPLRAKLVTITRFAPAHYFADGADNLKSLCKPILDGLADALGVNDKVFVTNPTEAQRQSGAIGIEYHQIDGPWGVRITIEPA